MIIRPYIALAAVFTLALKGVQCLYCLTCDDVPNARDCNTLKECGPSEACYHTSVVGQSGRITRRLGCRDKLQCPGTSASGPIGRRAAGVGRRAGDLILCDACCSKDFCQTSLCMDKDFPSPHGPICFACHSQIIEDCNKFQVCGRDQVCYESLRDTTGIGDVVKETGCYGKQPCENIKMSLGKRRDTTISCFNCCSDFMCNNNCTMATSQPPTGVTGPPGSTNTTGPGCVDKTLPDICRVAAQYVCTDRDKAHNANCLHFCGFC